MDIKELDGKSVMAGMEVDFDRRTITPINPGCVITLNHFIGMHELETGESNLSAAVKRFINPGAEVPLF